MSNDDSMLASALWLVAGGAAGYAAGRFVVGPMLADRPKLPRASSSTGLATLPAQRPRVRATRALGAGPSGTMQPIDPYGSPVNDVVGTPYTGPSGEMRPIDPYADATPSIAPVTISIVPTTNTPTPADGPITRPPELPIATTPSTSGPITRPSEVSIVASPSPNGPITRPSQVDTRPHELTAPVKPAKLSVLAPSTAFATKPRVRRFDALFAKYRGDLPIEYVRALV